VFFLRIYDSFKAMPNTKINAPAKLNLHLNIGERRPDGFHNIESLFLALTFGDTLYFETNFEESGLPSVNTEIILDWLLPWGGVKDLSPEKNIVNKAVSLFRERTGFDKKLKIVLEKRIPLGGGLGGGSSDAAATLLALNSIASPDKLVSDDVLAEMGVSLGSDVPFFLQIAMNDAHPIAWVSGRGEQVQPLSLPPQIQNLSIILVNPGFSSDTAKAFSLLDENRVSETGNRQSGVNISAEQPSSSLCPQSLTSVLSGSPKGWPFSNDFLSVFEADFKKNKPDNGIFSNYWEIITTLMKLGADFSGLSGSGSTCYGVFSSQSKSKTAREVLCKRWNFVIETFSLAFKTIQWYNIK
jgi:4-diphosphocytidyl-2-C-methyl-D-erythritol kinase